MVDQMLMSVGRWLRLVGMDVANPGEADDRELLIKARKEDRVLLTRDRRLSESCKTAGVECILIRSTNLIGQLKEMTAAGVKMELDPRRCTVCNSPLIEVAKGDAKGERCQPLENRTWQCEGCKKLYWAGSHWRRIRDTLDKVRSEVS